MSKNEDYWEMSQKTLEYLLNYYKNPNNENEYTDTEKLDNLIILSRVYRAIQGKEEEKKKKAEFNKGIEPSE